MSKSSTSETPRPSGRHYGFATRWCLMDASTSIRTIAATSARRAPPSSDSILLNADPLEGLRRGLTSQKKGENVVLSELQLTFHVKRGPRVGLCSCHVPDPLTGTAPRPRQHKLTRLKSLLLPKTKRGAFGLSVSAVKSFTILNSCKHSRPTTGVR